MEARKVGNHLLHLGLPKFREEESISTCSMGGNTSFTKIHLTKFSEAHLLHRGEFILFGLMSSSFLIKIVSIYISLTILFKKA